MAFKFKELYAPEKREVTGRGGKTFEIVPLILEPDPPIAIEHDIGGKDDG